MMKLEFEDQPPIRDDGLTDYDERHLATYLRLLDAAEEGADCREAFSIIFQIDPAHNPARARQIYESHLSRARWMTCIGYRYLLVT